MKKSIISASIGFAMALLVAGSALAAGNPQGTGQPGAQNETCGQGNASAQPTGFSTTGFAHAETVYAGSDGTQSQQNAQSAHAVSQYDIACFQQTANH